MFGSENLRRIEPLLQTPRDVATDVGAEPAQVALAWLISLPKVGAIPGELGTRSGDALTDAARAFRPVSALDYFSARIREKLGRRQLERGHTRCRYSLVRGAGAAVCSGGNQICAFSS